MKDEVPDLKDFDKRLRDEAHEDLADIVSEAPTSKTQIIAIYGKGGIGKSFTLANLSHMMAEQGKRVLLIGCDPKSDTTSLLFGGKACPTIIETSSRKKLAGEEVAIGDVCFKRGGVFAMELGGPEVGRGCGGRGIIHGFELLEKLGFHEWDFDYVLLDFLGDVVCGGFGLPIARDMAQKVILVASNDLQSLYVANNVCSAVEYFRKLGGNVGVAGLVINKDDGSGEAAAFAEAVDIPVLAAIPQDDGLRKKSANYQIVGSSASPRGALRRVGRCRGRGAAGAADAAGSGRFAQVVRCQGHGRRLCPRACHRHGHARQERRTEGQPGGRVRRCLSAGDITCPTTRWARSRFSTRLVRPERPWRRAAAARPVRCATPRARRASRRSSTSTPGIIRRALTTSRSPCVPPLALYGWGCG